MKKILPVIILSLAGCATTQSAVDTSLVAQIRAGIIATCGYQVGIDSLIHLIGTFTPGVNIASIAIDTVCAAVAPLVVGHAGPKVKVPTPVVNGVVIRGHFVRKPAG